MGLYTSLLDSPCHPPYTHVYSPCTVDPDGCSATSYITKTHHPSLKHGGGITWRLEREVHEKLEPQYLGYDHFDVFQWVPKITDEFQGFWKVAEIAEVNSTKIHRKAHRFTGNIPK